MEDFDSSIKDTTEEEIQFSRKNQKELVHPYRKYQLSIILLIIIMITFIWVLFSLNTELSIQLKQHESLYEQYQDNLEKLSELKTLYGKIEVNYKSLYQLDKELNIDIIKTIDELNLLKKFISPNSRIQFSLCYKATIDGDNDILKFRRKCEFLSPILMLIETSDGYRFGAYSSNALNFEGRGQGYVYDSSAFIFSFDTKKMYNIIHPEFAIGELKDNFPSFGRQDIFLGNNFLSESSSYTNFPYDFEKDNTNPGDFILNGGMKKFKVKEMEFLFVYINF
jgi:hypothetical protein